MSLGAPCSNCQQIMNIDELEPDDQRVCSSCALATITGTLVTKADRIWLKSVNIDYDAKGGSENERKNDDLLQTE